MGAGLILIPLAILLYVPLFLWSIHFYHKTKTLSAKEAGDATSSTLLHRPIIFLYVVAVLCNENFGRIILDAIEFGIIYPDNHWFEYWLKQDIKSAFLGWDDIGDIAFYWSTIAAAYVIAMTIAFLWKKHRNQAFYQYNLHKLSVFNLFIHPFIILSIIGRLFRWEPVVNKLLGL